MDVVESLTAHVRAGDVDAVDGLLRSLSSSERATAKRWFDGSRGWFRDLWDTVLPGDDDPRLAHEQRLAVYRASR